MVRVPNESSWSTDLKNKGAFRPCQSGRGPAARDSKVWDRTKGNPRKLFFGNVVETKVVGDDETSYFKYFVDVRDHLGEVQQSKTPRSGT